MRKRLFTKQLGIPVEEGIYEKIISLCDEGEETISSWVRDAIKHKLSQNNNNITTKED